MGWADPPGLLTPFARMGVGGSARTLRAGVRFDAAGPALGMELAGERREDPAREPENRLTFRLRRVF